MIRVSFQGERGAYSEAAAKAFFKTEIQTVPLTTFAEVLESTILNKTDYSILPVENSLEGSVGQSYDLLYSTSLNAVGEIYHRIEHCLIGNGTLEETDTVYSHPQALGQCRDFIEKHNMKIVPTYDTAGSVKIIKESFRCLMIYTFNIFRYDPKKDREPRRQEFRVDLGDTGKVTVLDALFEILNHQDGTLAFRFCCRAGVCGSCAMVIAGKVRLACETQISQFQHLNEVLISPLPHQKVVKDLAVDYTLVFDRLKAVKPYLVGKEPYPEKEFIQLPKERVPINEPIDCIMCGSCTSACTMAWLNENSCCRRCRSSIWSRTGRAARCWPGASCGC